MFTNVIYHNNIFLLHICINLYFHVTFCVRNEQCHFIQFLIQAIWYFFSVYFTKQVSIYYQKFFSSSNVICSQYIYFSKILSHYSFNSYFTTKFCGGVKKNYPNSYVFVYFFTFIFLIETNPACICNFFHLIQFRIQR